MNSNGRSLSLRKMHLHDSWLRVIVQMKQKIKFSSVFHMSKS